MTSRRLQFRPGSRVAVTLGAGVILFALWQFGWDKTDFLPAPVSTFEMAVRLLGEFDTYVDLGATASRLAVGLMIGYLAAVAVALLMQISSWWNRFFSPYVYVAITSPSMVVSLVCLMVFGLAEFGVYMSIAIVVFPFVVVSLDEGVKALDPKLTEMSRVYGFSSWSRIRHHALPEMAPYLFAAFRNVHALGWKIVVIAELFSQQVGIGAEYKRAYGFFELERLVVWTFFFIAMVTIVEYLVLRPVEARIFRWRATSRTPELVTPQQRVNQPGAHT